MEMSAFPRGTQCNIGHLCTRHQCDAGNADKTALVYVPPSLATVRFTFADLERLANKFANVLSHLGFIPGEVFFLFLPRVPDSFIAILGALKMNLVTGTLFPNFGDDALLDRLGDAKAKGVMICKSSLHKITRIREKIPSLQYLLVIDLDEHQGNGVLSLRQLMSASSESFVVALTSPDTPSLLHYTSGSTGKPKGALHRHGSVAWYHHTTSSVLQLQDDDIYWGTADLGWITGTSYGIIGPMSRGITQVHYGGEFEPRAWMTILEREGVNVWFTAPTALRMLLREGEGFFGQFNLEKLRHIFSVGEPLNPEIYYWGEKILGKIIYDTWFQTETGGFMISNRPGVTIKPGSMGKAVDGIEVAILDDLGAPVPPGEPGNLCLGSGWPSMFTTYLNNEETYRCKFLNGYYFSGDTAVEDADGYIWFKGRSDDVINTAGHLVSPFEVESALLEMKQIAESGVVGVPDELLYEKVIAFVALHDGCQMNEQLHLAIRLYISQKVSTFAAPHEVIVLDAIPKNSSGKIMRRYLKCRYLGENPGDISTLEPCVGHAGPGAHGNSAAA